MALFNDVYKKNKMYYGAAPSPHLELLLRREKIIKGNALDVGCGDGRNSIFLAQNGFQVVAIDNSEEAIRKVETLSNKRELGIRTVLADVTKYKYEKEKYSIVVANTIIDHLEKDQGNLLLTKLKNSLLHGGVIFVSVFTIDDPGNKKTETYSETAQHVKRYFEHDELKGILSDLTLLKYHEEVFLDTNHGKPHYHSMARIVAKQK